MALINPATLAVGANLLAEHGPKAMTFVSENWPHFQGLVGNFGAAKGEDLKTRVAELVNTLDDTERKLAEAEAKLAARDADLARRREHRLLAIIVAIVLCALAAFGLGFATAHFSRS